MTSERKWQVHAARWSRAAWVALRHGSGAGVDRGELASLAEALAADAARLLAEAGDFVDARRLVESAALRPFAGRPTRELVGELRHCCTAARLAFGVEVVGRYGDWADYDPRAHEAAPSTECVLPRPGQRCYVAVPGYASGAKLLVRPVVRLHLGPRGAAERLARRTA